jgi:hypothetical protein
VSIVIDAVHAIVAFFVILPNPIAAVFQFACAIAAILIFRFTGIQTIRIRRETGNLSTCESIVTVHPVITFFIRLLDAITTQLLFACRTAPIIIRSIAIITFFNPLHLAIATDRIFFFAGTAATIEIMRFTGTNEAIPVLGAARAS